MISVRQEHIFRVFSQPPAVSVRTPSVFRNHPTAEAVFTRAFQGQNVFFPGLPPWPVPIAVMPAGSSAAQSQLFSPNQMP